VLRFVRELELGAQLAYLRLPSLRGEQQLADAQAALAGMRALVEVDVAREYGHGHAASLWHPSAKVGVPTPVPWPPLDQVDMSDGLWIAIPGHPGHGVGFRDTVRLMEHAYAELPAGARAAWDEFWRLQDLLRLDDDSAEAPGKAREISVPAGVLAHALEPANLDRQQRWSELREQLRGAALAPDAGVRMTRTWTSEWTPRRRPRVRPAGAPAKP